MARSLHGRGEKEVYPNTPPILVPASLLMAKRQTAPRTIKIRPSAAASFTEPPI
jgi:hypothetical protein